LNLPDYFLADLPPEATLSSAMLAEACRTLKHNRERFLANRSTESLIRLLSDVASRWLEPSSPLRQLALDRGPVETGFSRPTLARGLDAFFKVLTPEAFRALIEQEFGHARRLDRMVSSDPEAAANRAAIATAPEFLVHLASGKVPNFTWASILFGLLLRSAQFVKCARGTAFLPRLLAHSVYEADPKLGACLEIAEWRDGNDVLEAAVFHEADCVTATGSEEALAAIRGHLPARTRFLGYAHRVSFAYVAGNVLGGLAARRVVSRAGADITVWDQLGGLAPHVIYVQTGGALAPEAFAAKLAADLAEREASEPRGALPAEAATAITSRRSFYEVRAAHSPETLQWCSPQSTAWTVVFEADPRFQMSCLHRFVYVKGVSCLADALRNAEAVRGKVSTVALAATDDVAEDLATELARWGVTRVCPLGQMSHPPLTWRHDGRPAMGDLVTWTDWEMG